jgi:hypothetical protein
MKRSDQPHRKEARKLSADKRALAYALLTVEDKIAKAHKNGGRECKEYEFPWDIYFVCAWHKKFGRFGFELISFPVFNVSKQAEKDCELK